VGSASTGAPEVGAGTRRFVHLFLAVFVVCGIGTFEVLPFSGFRLFSELRGDDRRSWQLRAVDDDGDEHAIVLGDLPLSYRKSTILIEGWEERSREERDEICEAWSGPLRASGVEVRAVRIYRVVASLRPGGGAPDRRLAYTCGRHP
jgi:hypothetical protein